MKIFRLVGLAVILYFSAPLAVAQTMPAPFHVAWTNGTCQNCELVRELDGTGLFASKTFVSGAYLFPTEGQGAGDYSLVRSLDGGKHWREITRSRMHASAPSSFFFGTKAGWASGMSMDGEGWLLKTQDAGLHWKRLSDHFIQQMRFTTPRVGFGAEFNGTGQEFAKTSDGGRIWTHSAVPGMRYISKIYFLDASHGWVAGTNGPSEESNSEIAVVRRTNDGGLSWAPAVLLDTQVADVRDLYFLNERDGWLITWRYNNEGTHLFHTTDGGATWKMHPDLNIQGAGTWLSLIRFVTPKIGFAFNRKNQVDTSVEPPAVGVVAVPEGGSTGSGQLLYTQDAGEHWQSYPLGAWVSDCVALGTNALGCTASKENSGFTLLRIQVP